MKQWINMMCLVLLLFMAGSTQAGSLSITANCSAQPAPQVTFTASPTHVAHLPEVMQAVTYSPVVHRASLFLLHGLSLSHILAACAACSPSLPLLPGAMHVQAIPLHLAIRVLLI